jgi:Protein of unknown function (DUF3489)
MTDIPQGSEVACKNPKAAKPKSTKVTRPAQLHKLLTRKSGATIAQIQNAFGWQPHTARAAISGLRKRGETVQRSDAAKGSVYRILTEGAAP